MENKSNRTTINYSDFSLMIAGFMRALNKSDFEDIELKIDLKKDIFEAKNNETGEVITKFKKSY